jgi:hypothetical protein
MSKIFWERAVFLLILATGGIMGCGENLFENLAENDTQASKIESAQIALDSRSYASAITTLQEICGIDPSNPTCDNTTRAMLASAYSGLAGLDAINLINNASTGTITSFGSFSSLLPAPTAENKTAMNNAVTLLSGIPSKTTDQNLQLAAVAVADVVVAIGADLNVTFDPQTGLPSSSPPASGISAATLSQVSNDVTKIAEGVTGSGLTNADLTNDINQIKSDLAGTDSSVSATELHNFLCNLNPSATGCP